jgi:hypothetical protein
MGQGPVGSAQGKTDLGGTTTTNQSRSPFQVLKSRNAGDARLLVNRLKRQEVKDSRNPSGLPDMQREEVRMNWNPCASSRLGPFMGRGRWMTGGALVSLAFAMAGVTVTGGAAAASPRADDLSMMRSADESGWSGDHESWSDDRLGWSGDHESWSGDHEGDQKRHKRWWLYNGGVPGPAGPAGPAGPPGPAGPAGPCADIDSYAPNAEEFSAVVSNGVTYAGRRDLQPTEGPYTWIDLSNNGGYPGATSCGVAISSQGNDLWVTVLTTTGEVWQTHCDVQGTTLVCNEDWIPQTTPTPAP